MAVKHGVTISFDTWLDMLEDRRKEVEKNFGWTIPDGVWEQAIAIFEDCGGSEDPQRNDPMFIVDNIAVNGDYGAIEEYGVFSDIENLAMEKMEMTEEDREDNNKMDALADYIEENIEELCEELKVLDSCFFLYDEPDSAYSKGICYSL
jgi:hypothetical protein